MRISATTTVCVALAALLAACGGSSGAASPSSSPSATGPGTQPLPGTAAEAAAVYLALFAASDEAALAAASTPAEAARIAASVGTIASARLVAVEHTTAASDGRRLLQLRVYIEPLDEDERPTPWGEAREHTLFMTLAKAPGGWPVAALTTSP